MINPNFLQRRLKEYFSSKCIFFLLIQCTLVSHYRNQLFYLCAIAEKEKLGPVDFDGMNYLISDKKGPFFVIEALYFPVGSQYNTFIEANQSIHAIQQNVQINMNQVHCYLKLQKFFEKRKLGGINAQCTSQIEEQRKILVKEAREFWWKPVK